MSSPSLPEEGQAEQDRILLIALLAALLVAAVLTAVLTFSTVRDLVASWEITSLPGVAVRESAPVEPADGGITDASVPLQGPGGPPPVEWDGTQRVTLLLVGLDARESQVGNSPPRTDLMILLTLDPLTRAASMLSIPRDLWVNIPGYNYGRINTAYQLGEAYDLPGGGPQLAMETVEELLGIPVDYYLQIDFNAFVHFVDVIGGVKLDVPQKIQVDPLGDNNTKTIRAGRQTLSGELALAYARASYDELGDFDRSQRQQQVILAIRDQILRFDLLPQMITRSKILYAQLSAGLHTNLSLNDAIRLAWLAQQVPEGNIQRLTIGEQQVAFAVSPDGAQQVLKPLPDPIRALRDQMFSETGSASPATGMDPAARLQGENARVLVLNATTHSGLAAETSTFLQGQGINVVNEGNAQAAEPLTKLTLYSGKPYTLQFLAELFKVEPDRIYFEYDPSRAEDIAVVLGQDWVDSDSLP